MAKPPLYFLIEETNRELSSRLLMTHFACELGYPVVILPQWLIWENLHSLPRGIILFKGNSAIQTKNMGVAKRAGHIVVSIEEEAFGIADSSELTRCYDKNAGAHCDLFLFQGPLGKEAAEKHLVKLERFAITGNPRADFLRAPLLEHVETEARSIQEKYGPSLLINTNFAAFNARDLDAYSYFEICARAGWVNRDSIEDIEAWYMDAVRYERGCLRFISALIRGLVSAELPWNIIIRPHPAEKFDTWNRNFASLPRTMVLREGDHTAWTKAADLLIHPSCTTGMEAQLMGTPAICVVPNDAVRGRVMVSSLVNPTFRDAGVLRDYVMERAIGVPTDTSDEPEPNSVTSDYLTTWPNKLSAQVAVQALNELVNDIGSVLPRYSSSFTVAGGVTLPDPSIEPELITPTALSSKLSAICKSLGYTNNLTPREIVPTMTLLSLRVNGDERASTNSSNATQ